MYRFECHPWGRCQIETSTSGKYGFGLPKLFRITSCDAAFKGVHTLRFTDRIAMGVGALAQKNADLIRLAIGQFCAGNGDRNADSMAELDLTVEPFDGEVTNRHGRVISTTSLLPRERGQRC